MDTVITIEPVETVAHVQRVAALAREIWNEHYVPIIGKAQVDYMLEQFQSFDSICSQINDGQEYYLAHVDGRPAGYLGLIPEEPRGKLMLSKIYVRSECRGHGVGSRLLDRAFERGTDLQANAVWLRVNRHNAATLAWYRNRGFVASEEVKSPIGGGFYMDDYVMERALVVDH